MKTQKPSQNSSGTTRWKTMAELEADYIAGRVVADAGAPKTAVLPSNRQRTAMNPKAKFCKTPMCELLGNKPASHFTQRRGKWMFVSTEAPEDAMNTTSKSSDSSLPRRQPSTGWLISPRRVGSTPKISFA